MRKLITTISLLALVDTSVAIAYAAGSRNRAAPPATNSGQQLPLADAPVGHRQPRADQVPSEKSPMDDSINRERRARPHDQEHLPRLLKLGATSLIARHAKIPKFTCGQTRA
jgi:hypothetical protein